MKRILLTLCVLVSFLMASPVLALSGDKKTNVSCGTDDSGTSVAIASAVAGSKYQLYAWYVSSDSVDEISVKSGSTTLIGIHAAANGGLSENMYPMYVAGADNEALTIAKLANTDLIYCLWYTLE